MNVAESAYKPTAKRDPCCETTDSHSFALYVTADDGVSYLFGVGQFLDAKLDNNFQIENDPQAPPERLHIRYATGEVVVLGWGLHKVADWIGSGRLKSIKPLGSRHAALQETWVSVSSITVTTKENP
jgi:hypothetical protein